MTAVLFVEPAGSEANIFDNCMKLPLMGSLILGTILDKAGYEVTILNENILGRRLAALELRADVVCFTCLSVNAARVKELAAGVRALYPSARLLVGGIHPSLCPEEFTGLADHVVIGEAEEIIVDLVAGRCAGKIVTGRPVEDLDALPLVNYALLADYRRISIIPVMTSRGCPFNCNFCTVTRIFGRRYRSQSVDRVMRELRHARSFFTTPYLFFYDDNLTADRARIDALLDRLIAEDLGLLWTAQVRADIAQDETLLARLFAAGCERVYIGFESIDDAILKALHKSQSRAQIEQAIARIHHHGINIHGMFIFGAGEDTPANIRRTTQFAMDHDIDTLQFMLMTPFPGTALYEELSAQHRLLHRDWSYYDGMHVVFQPLRMTPAELMAETVAAYRRFYSIQRTAYLFLRTLFDVSFDAFVWNFSRANRYDFNNLVLKVGARLIIWNYTALNREYDRYLESVPAQ